MTKTIEKKFKIDDLFVGKYEMSSILDFPEDHVYDELVPIVGVLVGRLLEIYSLQEVQVFLDMLNKTYEKSFKIIYNPSTNITSFYDSHDHPTYNMEIIIKLIVKNIYRYFGIKSNPLDESYIVDKYLRKDIKEFDIKNLGLYDTVQKVLDFDFFYYYNNLKVLYNIEGEPKPVVFDQSYKHVINKIDLLTQFVKKMNPGIDYRRIYQSSRDLGSYVLELRSVLVKNIRFKMAKEGLDNTEFKNDYVENMMRATESILFMMQTDISDNDNELISFENEKFKQTLEKYTDILSKLYGTDFRKKCTLFSLFEDEAFMQARYVTGELRLAALDLCIKKFDEMQSK
jgi:hypothetical protein